MKIRFLLSALLYHLGCMACALSYLFSDIYQYLMSKSVELDRDREVWRE